MSTNEAGALSIRSDLPDLHGIKLAVIRDCNDMVLEQATSVAVAQVSRPLISVGGDGGSGGDAGGGN